MVNAMKIEIEQDPSRRLWKPEITRKKDIINGRFVVIHIVQK